MTIEPVLNKPQTRFIELPQKYRAFVAGFGSGKTWVGCAAECQHSYQYPRVNAGYFAPTYAHIRDIFYPTMEEVAFDWGLNVKINESNKEVHLYSGKLWRNTILCRSLDKPSDIVGFKIGYALIDELDLLPMQKAALGWRKILARMRYKVPGLKNGVDVTTTPEGFKFVYEQFHKLPNERPELRDLYGLVQASTYDNAKNLPEDYIPSLRASYPPQLIDAYLRGQFCNLLSGSVYANFDRRLNHANAIFMPGEALHIGMDFNVMNMTATINVIRDNKPIQVGELTGVRDTPTMARILDERFRKSDKPHPVLIYPDASGQNTSSKDASESDLSILKAKGFQIEVNRSNPAVKDRVNAFNGLILNDLGERHFKINTDACPVTTVALEQQTWDKNGEPDKTTGHDHPVDAEGYFIVKRWPIPTRNTTRTVIAGV